MPILLGIANSKPFVHPTSSSFLAAGLPRATFPQISSELDESGIRSASELRSQAKDLVDLGSHQRESEMEDDKDVYQAARADRLQVLVDTHT